MPKIVICVDCNRKRRHEARGRCKGCYGHYRYQKRKQGIMGKRILCKECGLLKIHQAKGMCKPCYARYYNKKYSAKIAIYQRGYRQSHKRERALYDKQYYEEEQHKKDRQLYMRQYTRSWRKRHPERAKEITRIGCSNYRARKRHSPYSLTDKQAREILSIGRCLYCDDKLLPNKLELDHFVPLMEGGGTTRANLVAACHSCNASKKDKKPEVLFSQLALVNLASLRKDGD